jgi:hydroxymethylpyrimidine/phosphomethylpyrimidine kinase
MDGETVTDLLVTNDGEEIFTSRRIDTVHTHGTGCALASAVATGLAQRLTLPEAVTRARNYVDQAIRQAPGYGKGHGPLNHAWTVADGF